MEIETSPARLRKVSLRTLVETAREEGEGRRRERLAGLLADGPGRPETKN
jgi:ribosomal protein S7